MIWALIGGVAVALGVYLYLCLRHPEPPSGDEVQREIDAYKEQLAQIDLDAEQGLISDEESAALKLEVQRGLLQAAKRPPGGDGAMRLQVSKPAALALSISIPIFAVVLYAFLGSPELARFGGPPAAESAAQMTPDNQVAYISRMADKFRAKLEAGPANAEQWTQLATIYMQLARLEDAKSAYEKALAAGGKTADIYAGLGEAQFYLNDGKMSEAAQASFKKALELSPGEPASRFYLALGARQKGDVQASYDQLKALAADTPANAPWAEVVREEAEKSAAQLNLPGADLKFADPVVERGPTQADIEAAQNMSPEDQQAMIQQMVAGLAERLAADPSDFDGWIRLANAYKVMGQTDKAAEALTSAAGHFPDRTGQLAQIAKDMGLDVSFK